MAADLTEDEIVQKLTNYRKLQKTDWVRGIAGVPSVFNANAKGGNGAAVAASIMPKGYYRNPDGSPIIDKEKLLDMRANVANQIAKLNMDFHGQKSDVLRALAQYRGAQGVQAEFWRMAENAVTGNANRASAASAQSANNRMGVYQSYMGDLSSLTGRSLGGGGSTNFSGSAESFMKKQQTENGMVMRDDGSPQEVGLQFYQDLNNALSVAVDNKENVDILTAASILASDTGHPGGLEELLANAPKGSENLVKAIASKYSTMKTDVAASITDTTNQLFDNRNAALKASGVASDPVHGEQISAMYDQLIGMYKKSGHDPEEMDKALVDMFTNMGDKPVDSDKLYNVFSDLEKQYDMQPEFVPATAREAKDEVIRSDWFEKFKQTNGLKDDRMAFKALVKIADDKRRTNRSADAAKIQQGNILFPGASPAEPPPPVSAEPGAAADGPVTSSIVGPKKPSKVIGEILSGQRERPDWMTT